MAPSNTDNGRHADLDDDSASLEPEDAQLVDESPAAPEDFEEDFEAESEPDDGLAPEAGRGRPSLLSILLLAAGAIWIVVALLKLGDGEAGEGTPPAAIHDMADAGEELPDLAELDGQRADAADTEVDEATPPEAEDGTGAGELVDDPERGEEPEVGTPASERGPPESSLLAGKVWPRDYVAPEVVHYTIKRGGSMKIVANLYKIFHHEMEALNPGVKLDRELPPSTRLVVYKRKPGQRSESIGFPGDGKVEGAMPMIDGPGRELKHTPWKGWATTTTVATLDLVLREWARRFPDRQPILVGNMSARNGGRLKPHSSHQSGRDVDLSYPQIWDRKEELNWRTMDSKNLDRELTWSLLELLRETGAIEHIFIDSKLQKLLYDYARDTERHSKAELAEWMEYPKPPGSGSPIIQHVRGHVDHIHVRFKCTSAETRCQSRER